MFKRILNWYKNKKVKLLFARNCIEIQNDPIVYVDGINYCISPDTIENKLIFDKAFKIWIRLWDMTDFDNRLRLSGVLKWKGAEIDLMKEGKLSEEEYKAASAIWVGLFSLMHEECREKYENGVPSF